MRTWEGKEKQGDGKFFFVFVEGVGERNVEGYDSWKMRKRFVVRSQ